MAPGSAIERKVADGADELTDITDVHDEDFAHIHDLTKQWSQKYSQQFGGSYLRRWRR